MRTFIFLLLFACVLCLTTLANPGGTLGFGWSTFTSYGWPRPWLHVHFKDTTKAGLMVDGKPDPGAKTRRVERVDVVALVISASAAAGIAAVLALPLFLFLAKGDGAGSNDKSDC